MASGWKRWPDSLSDQVNVPILMQADALGRAWNALGSPLRCPPKKSGSKRKIVHITDSAVLHITRDCQIRHVRQFLTHSCCFSQWQIKLPLDTGLRSPCRTRLTY